MKKIFSTTLFILTLLIGNQSIALAADTTTKLSAKQSKSLLNIAIENTNLFIDSKALETTLTTASGKFIYRLDSKGNVEISEPDNGQTYLFGFDTYTTMKNREFTTEELEIIRSLNLNEKALWAHVDIRKVAGEDPKQMQNAFKAEVLGLAHYNLTDTTLGLVEYSIIASKLVSNAKGKTLTSNWKSKESTGLTIVTMNSKNIITQVKDVQTDLKSKKKTSKFYTLKSFTTSLAKPQDAYLEWGDVYMDPRYKTYVDLRNANNTFNYVFSDVVAVAKMNNHAEVTKDDVSESVWSMKDSRLLAYGVAVEYNFIGANGKSTVACGMLSNDFNFTTTTDPSSLKLSVSLVACATLGYLPSPARL